MNLEYTHKIGDDVYALCELTLDYTPGSFIHVSRCRIVEWKFPEATYRATAEQVKALEACKYEWAVAQVETLNALADRLEEMILTELQSDGRYQEAIESAIRDRDEAAFEKAEEMGFHPRRSRE